MMLSDPLSHLQRGSEVHNFQRMKMLFNKDFLKKEVIALNSLSFHDIIHKSQRELF